MRPKSATEKDVLFGNGSSAPACDTLKWMCSHCRETKGSCLLPLHETQGRVLTERFRTRGKARPDDLVMDKKTHHLENPEGTDGKWLEPMRDFLTLAHQVSYVASAGSAEEKAEIFKKSARTANSPTQLFIFPALTRIKFWRKAKIKNWGLKVDARRSTQVHTVQLVIAFYRRRKARLKVSLDEPFPPERQPAPLINQKTVQGTA